MKALAGRVLGTVARVKQVVALGIGGLLVLVALATIRQAGTAVLRASEGADVRTVFRRSLTAPAEIRDRIHWLPDQPFDGRVMEPKTRSDLADAYAQAWSAIDRASQGDPEAPVGEYLAGAALAHVRRELSAHAVRSTSVKTTHVSHSLELTYYSADGAVVSLNAPEVIVERLVSSVSPSAKPQATVVGTSSTTSTTTTIARPTIPDGITETVYRSVESYRLVMLLRDGNWRVELIERLAAKEPLVATDWNVSTTKARVPVRISTTVEARTQEPSTTIEFNSARREWPR